MDGHRGPETVLTESGLQAGSFFHAFEPVTETCNSLSGDHDLYSAMVARSPLFNTVQRSDFYRLRHAL